MNRAHAQALPAPSTLSASGRWSRRLATGAIAGPVLFTTAWLTLGFISPGYPLFDMWISPYSPISQPISGLGLGSTGPVMNTAFVLAGLLLLVGVIAIFQSTKYAGRPAARRLSTVLLVLSPIGMIVAGIFTLEDVLEHLIGFLLAVGAPVIGFAVAGSYFRRIERWRRLGTWLLIASPVTLVLVILFFATFNPMAAGDNVGIAGLVQRILTIEIHACFVAMAWRVARRTDG